MSSRGLCCLLIAAVSAIIASGCSLGHVRVPSPGPPPLSDASGSVAFARTGINYSARVGLAHARAEGQRALFVAIVTRAVGKASVDSLVTAVDALGGHVLTRFDEVGYVRALMPTSAIAKLGMIACVADYALGNRWGFSQSPGGDNGVRLRTIPVEQVPGAIASANHPSTTEFGRVLLTPSALESEATYLAHDEIRVPTLAISAPLSDGRGVTIGIVEGVPDFAHEAFREARTIDGETIPKLAGLLDVFWYSPSIQAESDSAGSDSILIGATHSMSKVNTPTMVTTRSDTVTIPAGTLRLPAAGTWLISSWARTRSIGLNSSDTVPYVVAWRDTLEIWLDGNRDNDLRNDGGPVPNINVRAGAGLFPKDSAISAIRASAFAVAFATGGVPYVYEPFNGHATMVTGTAAGSRFLGSAFGGVAPGARVLTVRSGAGPEDFVYAARDSRVDVITNQTSHRLFPNDGGSLLGLLFQRLVQVYRKPIFISAGNSGPRLGTVGSTASAAGALGVGVYLSKRSYALHNEWHVPRDDNLALYSSRGPASDGALVPGIVAPSHVVTSGLCGGSLHDRTPYVLPSCYMLGSGTSNAAPFAAGAAARLISAGRLHRLPSAAYDGAAIAWALAASAREVIGVGIHEQGAGLIQIDSAWKLLRLAPTRPRIVSSGPVENAYSPYLFDAGRGPGLYLREGWFSGRVGTRSVAIMRTSGPRESVRYRLRWRGNDGTFAFADSALMLPLGTRVELPVRVAPNSPGIHSAAIEVRDASSNMLLHLVPTTVIAGLRLTEMNGFTVRHSDTLSWPGNRSTFVEVPNGTAVLRVAVTSQSGAATVRIQGPLGSLGPSVTRGSEGTISPERSVLITVADPTAGTWEFAVAPPRQSEGRAVAPPDSERLLAYTLAANALMGDAEHAVAATGDVGVVFSNRGAAVPHASVRGEMGLRKVFAGTIPAASTDTSSPPDPVIIPLEPGTTALRVSLAIEGEPNAPRQRADLHVYECRASPNQRQREQCTEHTSIFADPELQEVEITNPKAATWKVVVDPAGSGGRPIRYSLSVITTHPKWGEVGPAHAADTLSRALSPHERWHVPLRLAQALPTPAPPQGSEHLELVAVVKLLSNEVDGEPVYGGWAHGPAAIARVTVPVRRLHH